jgi:hypothetical protein
MRVSVPGVGAIAYGTAAHVYSGHRSQSVICFSLSKAVELRWKAHSS